MSESPAAAAPAAAVPPARCAGPAGPIASRILVGLIAGACAIVPCLFTTRLSDTFVVPKLAALWLLLAAGLLVVAGALLAASPAGAPIRWMPAVDIPLMAFVGLSLLAWLASTDRHQSLFGERLQHQGVLTLLLYMGLFVLARHAVFDGRRLTLLFVGMTTGAVLIAGYAILQKAGLDPFWDGFLPGGRAFSTFGQPNALGAYLLMTIPPTLHLARITAGVRRALLLVATAEILLAILFTASRGALVGVAVMALVGIWLVRRRKRLVLLLAGCAIAAGVLGLLVLPGRGADGRLSMQNHLDQWNVAARITFDHPLLGTGPETFPDVFPRYSRSALSQDRAAYFSGFRVESAHNAYLTMTANTGVPALVAFAALLAGFLVLAIRMAAATADTAVRSGLFAIVVSVLGHLASDGFMTAEVTSSWLQWTLLAAGIGLFSAPARSGSLPTEGAGLP